MNTISHHQRITALAALLLTAVLLVYIMVNARTILVPLAWALFMALLILPAVKWMERRKMSRWLAIITALLVVTLLLSLLLYALFLQVAGLLGDIPAAGNEVDRWMGDAQQWLERRFAVSPEAFSEQLFTSVSEMVNAGLLTLRNSLYSVFRTLTLLSLIPLYVFFMLYYRDLFYTALRQLARSHQQQYEQIIHQTTAVVQQYLNGVALVTLVMAVLFYGVLAAFSIQYALFFAVVLAVFNLIPYIGVVLSSFIVVVYAIATTDSFFYPAGILVALWLIQQLENNLITPYVIGSRVKVNPLAALVAILAGGSIWGVSGMVLFIPAVGALKVLLEQFEGTRPLALFLSPSQAEPTKPGNEGEIGSDL